MREVNAILGKDIFLGRCGENKATCILFNISDWQKTYGDGTPYVLHQRNGDKQPYPCDIEVNGSIVSWCITNSDVAVAGRGRVELQYYKDDTLVKSETFTTATERGLGTPSETAPPPYEGWLENILGTATEAQEAAAEATESATLAVQSKAEAVASASAAAKSEANAKESEIAAASSASATALDAITARSNAEIAYEYSAAAKGYMAEADGSRKAAVEAAIEAQAYANSIVGDKEAAAASAASAKASASEAATSKAEAAASAARAEIAALDAARDAAAEVEAELVEQVADHVAAAERAEELARNAANESVLNQKAAANSALGAANHEIRAIEAANAAEAAADSSAAEAAAGVESRLSGYVDDAEAARDAAEDAKEAAEAAAREAQQAAGGDFATPAYVDSKAATAESNANQYTDQKIASIPTPDVSGQINTHNADETAHADIRGAMNNHIANKSNPHGVTAGQVGALPLSGGALNSEATLKLQKYGGRRFLLLDGHSITADITGDSSGGWATNFFKGVCAGSGEFSILGAQGDGTGVQSIFLGGWGDKLVSIAPDGTATFKSRPYHGNVALVTKSEIDTAISTHNAATDAHADIRQMAESAGRLAASAEVDAANALRDASNAYDEAISKASIFYCYADSTELWEIDEQIDNGNIVILNDIERYVPLVSASYGESYLFRGEVDDTTVISAYVDSDGWTVTESEIGGSSVVPEDHSSTETIYGRGNKTKYGHVKVSDETNSTYAASAGVAASPYAVKQAYDKATTAQTAANNAASAASAAQTTADSKAPMYDYGTADLTAGTSPLETGKLYFVYE